MKDVKSRALAAWITSNGLEQAKNVTAVRATANSLQYVILKRGQMNLAVYRIRTDGILKKMRRWPKEFQQDASNEP